ncbi:uncharacterized protein LOC101852198 [Aplysia californica]|uniref:Uncharacterized protein LOC101852198 n=1 Tax=Aplysia californica TaxID=6500 RepID=A0ABM1VXH0_APLCA|nr:uncharacterized protein LOC101852198 [Aplysia californica]
MLLYTVVTILALSNACQGNHLRNFVRSVVKRQLVALNGDISDIKGALASIQNELAKGKGAACSTVQSGWGPPFDVFGKGAQYYLAFRGTAGAGPSVYDTYIGKGRERSIEACCRQVNGSLPCSGHYRNAGILDNWQNIEEVVVALYDRGVLKQSLTFDAAGTDYLSWFSAANLKDPGIWRDLQRKHTNFFSITGDQRYERPFFINNKYGGCPGDSGWLVAADHQRHPCPWEKHSSYPQFLYSKDNGPTHWNKNEKIDRADVLAIFVKPYNGCNSQ